MAYLAFGHRLLLGRTVKRDDRMPADGHRKLFQVQRRRFLQVCHGDFRRLALRRGARLWIDGNEAAFFGVREHGSQFHRSSSGLSGDSLASRPLCATCQACRQSRDRQQAMQCLIDRFTVGESLGQRRIDHDNVARFCIAHGVLATNQWPQLFTPILGAHFIAWKLSFLHRSASTFALRNDPDDAIRSAGPGTQGIVGWSKGLSLLATQ